MSSQDSRDDAIRDLARSLISNYVDKPAVHESLFSKWANTPFVVTVLAGVLGTGLTLLWSDKQKEREIARADRIANAENEQQLFSSNRDSKLACIVGFSNDFPSAFSRMFEHQQRFVWLQENRDKQPAHSHSGKSYVEMWRDWDEQKRTIFAPPAISSFSPQILATFEGDEVRGLAELLTSSIHDLTSVQDRTNLNKTHLLIDETYDKLIGAMTAELRKVISDHKQSYEKKSED